MTELIDGHIYELGGAGELEEIVWAQQWHDESLQRMIDAAKPKPLSVLPFSLWTVNGVPDRAYGVDKGTGEIRGVDVRPGIKAATTSTGLVLDDMKDTGLVDGGHFSLKGDTYLFTVCSNDSAGLGPIYLILSSPTGQGILIDELGQFRIPIPDGDKLRSGDLTGDTIDDLKPCRT